MLDRGLGIKLVKALGMILSDSVSLYNELGKIPGLGNELGTALNVPTLLCTELNTTLDTALGDVVSLSNELGKIPGGTQHLLS